MSPHRALRNCALVVGAQMTLDGKNGRHSIKRNKRAELPKEVRMFTFPPFRDRTDAGQRLAAELVAYSNRPDVAVIALPRGGVPVAFEIARELNVPMDVFVVRKLGVPGHPEYAFGALASGGVRVIDDQIVRRLGIPSSVISDVAARELRELERREALYRRGRFPLQMSGKTVILVDDGIATGCSMRAAIGSLRLHRPARIAVAVPVGSTADCAQLRAEVDELVCLIEPKTFAAVGQWYKDFSELTDKVVEDILIQAAELGKVMAR
jgi:putative phosphoribosyl transferase